MRSRRTRNIRLAALVALGLVAVFGAAAASHATARGKNGRIAFRRWLNDDQSWGAIFTIDANGGHERQVTHPPKGTKDDQPDWSPDGSLIVFMRSAPNQPGAIYTVRFDGLGLRRLTPTCPKGTRPIYKCDNWLPAFSPDGQRIVFASGTGLVITDRNGRNRRAVTSDARYEFDDPQFSPDGKRLLFVRVNHDHVRPKNAGALFVAGTDAKNPHRITPWNIAAGDNPDWSPDGKWILFRSNVTTDKQSQIYLVHPNGTGLTRLTKFKRGAIVTSSSFSPDGKWIVFATTGVGGNADVYVMRTDGTGKHPVTRTKLWDSAPDWGPAR
jgi:TolB protein